MVEFSRDTWRTAYWSEELKPGALIPRTIGGGQLKFFSPEDGAPSVIGDTRPSHLAPQHMDRMRSRHAVRHKKANGRRLKA